VTGDNPNPPTLEFLVLEQHSAAEVRSAAVGLAARLGADTRVIEGWHRPAPGGPVVCVGPVLTGSAASAAVLAAVAGSSLVVDATADRDVIDRLCDDLQRLGRLEHRLSPPSRPPLPPAELDLLALLMGGATLGQAARALHLSRRTADRRLASARRALGAGSTAEAVAAAGRLGVKPVNLR
jgi:DNA-binding CsgD family transcriptional regulator